MNSIWQRPAIMNYFFCFWGGVWNFSMVSASILCWLTPVSAYSAEPVAKPPLFQEIEKIDLHVHIFDDVPEFVQMLKRLRIHVVNICVGGSQPELLLPCEKRAEQFKQQYPGCFDFASTYDLTRRYEPAYAQNVVQWLNSTFQAGAVLVKVWKDVGMQLKTPAGEFLMPDDPILHAVYKHLAQCHRPLMTHFADPIDAWRPLDKTSLHYTYYVAHPEWHAFGKSGMPSHAEILDAQDRMLAKFPDLTVIAAHLGSQAHDLDALGKRLDRFPNLYVDVAARTPELQSQPAYKVRLFFQKYQDRLLYGTDADQYTQGRLPNPDEQKAFARKMESWYRSEFEYYAGQGVHRIGGRDVECLGLSRGVLEKFYHLNAYRLMPGLKSQ